MVSDTLLVQERAETAPVATRRKLTSEAKKKKPMLDGATHRSSTKSAPLLNTAHSTKRRTIAFNLILITNLNLNTAKK